MKQNLLNPKSAQQLCKRLNKLTPGHKNYWGLMNPTEMLMHCNLCNTQLLEEKHDFKKPTLKQRFMKILGLYLKADIPRNRNGATRNETIVKVPSTAFYEKVNQFKKKYRYE